MICDKCGKSVADNLEFCPYCGNNLKKANTEGDNAGNNNLSKKTSKKKKENKYKFKDLCDAINNYSSAWVWIVTCVVALLVILLIVFKQEDPLLFSKYVSPMDRHVSNQNGSNQQVVEKKEKETKNVEKVFLRDDGNILGINQTKQLLTILQDDSNSCNRQIVVLTTTTDLMAGKTNDEYCDDFINQGTVGEDPVAILLYNWVEEFVFIKQYDYEPVKNVDELLNKVATIIGNNDYAHNNFFDASKTFSNGIRDLYTTGRISNNTETITSHTSGMLYSMVDELLVRIGPGQEYEAFAKLSKGDGINVIEEIDGVWVHTNYNGRDAYVSRQYLTDVSPEYIDAILSYKDFGSYFSSYGLRPTYSGENDAYVYVNVFFGGGWEEIKISKAQPHVAEPMTADEKAQYGVKTNY